jgi:hypothetical protein
MKGFDFLVDTKITQISVKYAKKKKVSNDTAMEIFLASMTYQLLDDSETGLYLEVVEYVYDEFLKEIGEYEE